MNDLTLDSGAIRARVEGALLHVTLDRADKRNALTRAMYADLNACVAHAAAEAAVHAVLLDAAGDMFCAGNDIGDFAGADPHGDESGGSGPALSFIKALRALDKAVVVAVQGQATGIGTTLLLHADLVIAADDARFYTAFIDLGLVPEAGSSALLPALIGRQNTARLLLAGDTLTAAEAERMGLIAYRVPANELAASAAELTERLCAKSPTAIRYTKQLIRAGAGSVDLESHIEREAELFGERLFSNEVKSILARFLNRRR